MIFSLITVLAILMSVLPMPVAAAATTTTTDSLAPVDLVDWIWSGAVTPFSVRVNAKLKSASNDVRLVVSEQADLSSPLHSSVVVADAGNNNTVSMSVSGLAEDTAYYYAVEAEGQVDDINRGEFHTFKDGPYSYTFAFAGDAHEGSNKPVFDTVREENVLFFVSPGDFMYSDINVNDINEYRDAFNNSLTASRQLALYKSLPIAYMWDDHDYGPNDSDGTSPSREAGRLAYQETVPHYPMQDDPADHPDCSYSDPAACRTINQVFTVGRTYFILTDLRSERDPNSLADNNSKTMMGTVQKQWFKDQLLVANGTYPLIIWLSSVPYIETQTGGSDRWGGYATERAEIANFIKDNNIEGLAIIAADAHMIALDDGTNSDYATGGGAAMPVLHSAALNRGGSVKGGPYSHGTYPNPSEHDGQYATVAVTDDGNDQICLAYTGKRLPDGAASTTTLINWSTCFPTVEAPVVTIEIKNGTDVVLSWSTNPLNCSYRIYRETSPFFDPNSTTPDLSVGGDVSSHIYAGDLGNPNTDFYYLVRAASCSSNTTSDSQRTGGFNYVIEAGASP